MQNNVFKKLFGAKIKDFRKERKMTQFDLAELVDVDPKHISCIENGINFPSSDLITKLAKAFNKEPYELFLFENKPPIEDLKKELLEIIENTTDTNIEKIYLYAKFLTAV